MSSSFFLVSEKNKKFLSHKSGKITYEWDVTQEQLWYTDENENIGAYGTRLMISDDSGNHSTSYARLMAQSSIDSSRGYLKNMRLVSIGNGLYKVSNGGFVADVTDEGGMIRTLDTEYGDFVPAIFRKSSPDTFLGCVHWDAAYHTTTNPSFVEEGLGIIKDMGFGVAKVKVNNPRETYRGRVPETEDEKDIIQVIEKVFKNSISSFSTIILSVWSTFEWDESYFLDMDEEELAEKLAMEHEFFYNLTRYLESNFTNKTFVLQNWESDWKFESVLDDFNATKKVSAWVFARQLGVSEGRNPNPTRYTTKVVHAFEVNKVASRSSTSATAIVLPRVDVDLVSYSMYETHEDGVLSDSLDFIQGKMRSPTDYMRKMRMMDERFSKRVYLGEFGTGYGSEDTRISKNKDVLVNAISWGCPFVLYWQLFENEWDYSTGGNPGRGLYLPKNPSSVVEGSETHYPVEKTNIAKWFEEILA